MKRAVILGECQGGVVEASMPRPKEDWVLVKIHAAPLCTEYKMFTAGKKAAHLGHEAAGEVVEIAQPGRVKVGDRVAVMPQYPCGTCTLCRSGEYIHCENVVDFTAFTGSDEGRATVAQYLLKQDWLLTPIPDDISYDHGAMACCGLGPTFGAFERMQVRGLDTVLITGLGPVGLGGVINAKHLGATVIAVESHPYRVAKAKELGADHLIDPRDEDALKQIMDLTKGIGVDKAVDCSGAVSAHRLAIDALRRRGQLTFVGESGAETPLVISRDMIRKGIDLKGNWHYNMKDTLNIMKVIAKNPYQLDKFITHIFSIDDIQRAWETQASGECGKVVVQPWS
ncbi:MAG TPA: alcohol dehydrogenase [Candidatus Latescibacteria bacterium]|nr:alcohol dehydrogenase [Candidatus Latescibacterota bacterium]